MRPQPLRSSPVSTREQIAARVAGFLADGSFVNVGIGMPGMVPAYTPDERGVYFHAEHGVLGFGAAATDPRADQPVLHFFSNQYTLRPGAAIVDHTRSFGLVRSGLLDATVLGAFEVAADGSFASHQNDVMPSAGVGGAPELAGSAQRVLVSMEHTTAAGQPRLVARCALPVGLTRAVDLVVTELGAFVPAGEHFDVVSLAEGVSLEQAAQRTGAPLRWAPDGYRVPPPQHERVDRRRNKLDDAATAVAAIRSGMTVAIGGWGGCGTPDALVDALAASGVRDLTVICCGLGPINTLFAAGCVRHTITSFASYAGRNTPSAAFDEECRRGRVTVELCSQGVLAERLRAGGSGVPGLWIPQGMVGRFHATDEVRDIGGQPCRFEPALRADVSLVQASRSDLFGNLQWVGGERNYNDAVAYAGRTVVAAADELVDVGDMAPEAVMVPGVVVDRVVTAGA